MWDELCDWYIELAKPHLWRAEGQLEQDPAKNARRHTVQGVLATCLETTMRLLHPFAPFVTEEIWQKLPKPPQLPGSLMITVFPQSQAAFVDAAAEADMGLVQGVVGHARMLRQTYGLPPAQSVDATCVITDDRAHRLLTEQLDAIQKIGKLRLVLAREAQPASGMVATSVVSYLNRTRSSGGSAAAAGPISSWRAPRPRPVCSATWCSSACSPSAARSALRADVPRRGARLAAQLQHPTSRRCTTSEDRGSYFFTMEYVHGEDAPRAAAASGLKKRLPINLALHVASGALAALQHAHTRLGADGKPLGVVHRDVTPSNVMVSFEGVVKLLDFGVAKASQRSVESQSGSIKGKIAYLSPEQCRGEPVDRRSDLYSLGIVLHEMLTGRRLYKRETDFASMLAIATEEVPKPSLARPELSRELDAIVMTAMAKDPAHRYASATEMLEAIETLATNERHLVSGTAMSRFLRELFGEKPEPWVELAEREDDPRQVTITSESISSPDPLAAVGVARGRGRGHRRCPEPSSSRSSIARSRCGPPAPTSQVEPDESLPPSPIEADAEPTEQRAAVASPSDVELPRERAKPITEPRARGAAAVGSGAGAIHHGVTARDDAAARAAAAGALRHRRPRSRSRRRSRPRRAASPELAPRAARGPVDRRRGDRDRHRRDHRHRDARRVDPGAGRVRVAVTVDDAEPRRGRRRRRPSRSMPRSRRDPADAGTPRNRCRPAPAAAAAPP